MRNKLAKKLKKVVMHEMYLGDGVTAEDLKKDRKSVFASSDFKPVYRGRKRNHKKIVQKVNHMLVNTEYDNAARRMCMNRTGKFIAPPEL